MRNRSHLFPKNRYYAKCTTALTAQAEQANKHDEKQDDVRGEIDDGIRFDAIDVEQEAASLRRVPCRANL